MLETTSKAEFLRVGLVRYPDARETVDYFETSVEEAILAAFQAKTNWKNFQPSRGPEGSLESGKTTGPADRYIQVWITGGLPHRIEGQERAWITLGLYWKAPRRPSAPVVAACYATAEKGKPIPLLDLPGRDSQIALGPLYKKGERRLLLEPRDDFAAAEAFALLLDAVDDALGASGTVESVT